MVFLELFFPNFRNVGSVGPAQQLIKLALPKTLLLSIISGILAETSYFVIGEYGGLYHSHGS